MATKGLNPYISANSTVQVLIKNEATDESFDVKRDSLIILNLASASATDTVYAVPLKYVKVVSQSAAGTTFTGSGTIRKGDSLYIDGTKYVVTDYSGNGDGTATYTLNNSVDLTARVDEYFMNFIRAKYASGATQNTLFVSATEITLAAGEQNVIPCYASGIYNLDYSDYADIAELSWAILEACERFDGVDVIRFNQ
jgi:hypothetical protein